jgi:hypothetical protein
LHNAAQPAATLSEMTRVLIALMGLMVGFTVGMIFFVWVQF